MTATVAAIVTALKADATIYSLVNTRVTDRDIRQTGWERTSAYFDADGVIRATLMVDDTGSTRPAFGHTAERLETVYVWGFAPRTTDGRADLADMMARVETLFHGWQVPATGAQAFPTFRLGQQSDDAGAVFDRVTLTLGGVLAVSSY